MAIIFLKLSKLFASSIKKKAQVKTLSVNSKGFKGCHITLRYCPQNTSVLSYNLSLISNLLISSSFFGRRILSWQFAVYASHANAVCLPYASTIMVCDPFYLVMFFWCVVMFFWFFFIILYMVVCFAYFCLIL